jgi:hypothetical protein
MEGVVSFLSGACGGEAESGLPGRVQKDKNIWGNNTLL